MHSDERVAKNTSKNVLTFWVFEFCYCCCVLSVFWGRPPLCWEVNKRQGLQWQSENKRHFCETGKVSTVFPRFFSRHFNEKIAKVKGGQAKVGFLASTWADFDVFLVKLQFWSENSWKCWKSAGIWRFHEKFSSIWRIFSNFELRPSKLTKNSPICLSELTIRKKFVK